MRRRPPTAYVSKSLHAARHGYVRSLDHSRPHASHIPPCPGAPTSYHYGLREQPTAVSYENNEQTIDAPDAKISCVHREMARSGVRKTYRLTYRSFTLEFTARKHLPSHLACGKHAMSGMCASLRATPCVRHVAVAGWYLETQTEVSYSPPVLSRLRTVQHGPACTRVSTRSISPGPTRDFEPPFSPTHLTLILMGGIYE